MTIGRFLAGIGALLWYPPENQYLLLKRAPSKDYGAGVWECVTGRVGQGEGFEDALRREIQEETGLQMSLGQVNLAFIIGTTHFYRGETRPEDELLGVVYCCSVDNPETVQISAEHTECCWVTAKEAAALLIETTPGTQWAKRVIARAEVMREHQSPALRAFFQEKGFETG